jgi:uncharacterized protein
VERSATAGENGTRTTRMFYRMLSAVSASSAQSASHYPPGFVPIYTTECNMTLEERLNNDLQDAIRNKEEIRKLAIRGVKTAITQAKVSGTEARELNDEEVLAIIGKQIKQRRDSIEEFKKGNRPDLVTQEQAEIDVLIVYLPQQLSEDEIRERAKAVIAELGVTDMKGLGPVMKRMNTDLKGVADGGMINRVVRELLPKG